jgi:hypothetical protein
VAFVQSLLGVGLKPHHQDEEHAQADGPHTPQAWD